MGARTCEKDDDVRLGVFYGYGLLCDPEGGRGQRGGRGWETIREGVGRGMAELI
jgi:hypothetical protein